MININLVKKRIDKLSEYYCGDILPTKEEKEEFIKKGYPPEYIEFIEYFGFGLVLEDILNLWCEPEDTLTVYKNSKNLEGTIIFGENLSGEMFIFNPANNWEVLILSDTGTVEKKFLNFSAFIYYYLDHIIDLLEE